MLYSEIVHIPAVLVDKWAGLEIEQAFTTLKPEPYYYTTNGLDYGFKDSSNCIRGGRYCNVHPPSLLTGADVVKENWRQIMIWKYSEQHGKNMWWKYVECFMSECYTSSSQSGINWNKICIQKCIERADTTLQLKKYITNKEAELEGWDKSADILEFERQREIIELRHSVTGQVFVNGERYYGNLHCEVLGVAGPDMCASLESCPIFSYICNAFHPIHKAPKICGYNEYHCHCDTKRDQCGVCGADLIMDSCGLCQEPTSTEINKSCIKIQPRNRVVKVHFFAQTPGF